MAQTVAKKQSNKSTVKLATIIIGVLVLAFSGYMISESARELISTFQLNQELKSVRNDLKQLEVKQSELSSEKAKLQDPTYVQNYARGKHLLSKSEEQVFILPKGE